MGAYALPGTGRGLILTLRKRQDTQVRLRTADDHEAPPQYNYSNIILNKNHAYFAYGLQFRKLHLN